MPGATVAHVCAIRDLENEQEAQRFFVSTFRN